MKHLDLTQILFLDIETVSQAPSFSDLPDFFQELWAYKAKQLLKSYDEPLTSDVLEKIYRERAAIFAEFGKIICISVGFIARNPDQSLHLRLKSFYHHDEITLLQQFSELLAKHYNDPRRHFICGHNIKEFDIPYICRRLTAHQIALPALLDIANAKPWETTHLLDTMAMWRFGDIKSFTSLKLLAAVFGIPSPKDDIDGSQVGQVFWESGDIKRIAHYCEKDVLATAQILLKYERQPLLSEQQITFVEA